MSWEELYPVVSNQAYYSVLRYDPRRKDKIQELVCQSYEKFLNDAAAVRKLKNRTSNVLLISGQKFYQINLMKLISPTTFSWFS